MTAPSAAFASYGIDILYGIADVTLVAGNPGMMAEASSAGAGAIMHDLLAGLPTGDAARLDTVGLAEPPRIGGTAIDVTIAHQPALLFYHQA